MTDADSQRLWMGDLPVREIQESIASLESHPGADRATREQKVATAYVSAIARVLREQSELYLELHAYLRGEGSSFALLRESALDQARIIAELFLSARRERVDLGTHAFPGQDPTAALFALDVIKSCDVLLTADDPDDALLLTTDEVDPLLHNPLMDRWWENALPRGEQPPPSWGSGVAPEPTAATDSQTAQGTVVLLAHCLEDSVRAYLALLTVTPDPGYEDELRAQALGRAVQITRLLHGNYALDVDFAGLDDALDPTAATALLKAIADSCVVFAAPAGDFERYGMTAAELQEAVDDPELRTWLDAAEELL